MVSHQQRIKRTYTKQQRLQVDKRLQVIGVCMPLSSHGSSRGLGVFLSGSAHVYAHSLEKRALGPDHMLAGAVIAGGV